MTTYELAWKAAACATVQRALTTGGQVECSIFFCVDAPHGWYEPLHACVEGWPYFALKEMELGSDDGS